MKLSDYLWKKVSINCVDGKLYRGHYVVAYNDRYDNIDEGEDSIGIKPDKTLKSGIELFEWKIKSIGSKHINNQPL